MVAFRRTPLHDPVPDRLRRCLTMLLGVVGALWLSAPRAAQADGPELLVIVGSGAGVEQLSEDQLAPIFTTTTRYWPNGRAIVVFNLPAKTPLRVEFDRAVLHMTPEQVGRFWIDRRIRGGEGPPRDVPEPALVARLVAKLSGSVGYVPVSVKLDNVRVVARIRQGKVLAP